jgi:hypothetical protein
VNFSALLPFGSEGLARYGNERHLDSEKIADPSEQVVPELGQGGMGKMDRTQSQSP